MDIDINFHEKDNYLFIKFQGVFIFDNKILLDKTMPQALQKYSCAKVLLDIRELDIKLGTFSTLDGYAIGEYFASLSVTPVKIKSAVLAKEAQIDHFIEIVAKNRGAFFEVFTSKEEAVSWLLSF